MNDARSPDVSRLVAEISAGSSSAADELFPVVYEDLWKLARSYWRSEPSGHTLQPTALVHETYLRLIDQDQVDWRGRTHFLAVGAQVMRRVLVDYARKRNREKRGGGKNRISLRDDLIVSRKNVHDVMAVDEALNKLAKLDQRQAKLVELRFFGGLTVEEAATILEISKRTAEKEWTVVRAWLRRELSDEEDEAG